MPKALKTFCLCAILISVGLYTASFLNLAEGEEIDVLKDQIKNKNEEVEELEKEIEVYQKEINKTLEEKQTLNNQIKQLQNTSSKLLTEIKLTNKKIENAGFTIKKINLDIGQKNNQIKVSENGLAEIIRKLDEEESKTLLEILLAHNNFSEFFENIERMEYLHKDINANLEELLHLKKDMENKQSEKKEEKQEHERLNMQLADQKQLIELNKYEKAELLTKTKNKEENYKNILQEKITKKDLFLQEMADLEAKLRIEIDPNSIPVVGSGILKWPLDKIKITQHFGDTPFATQNPQVYGGKGHNGIDFRASIGTPIKASLNGIVEEIGNTDAIPGCYSYGKWILLKHPNGLSTLYAHLSLIKVSKGQEVKTGELIGYSGRTGYATGPHLHFTVYASQGIKIIRLGDIKTITNCADARIPIADKKAYLNPLSYL